jgi:hypothetical protein
MKRVFFYENQSTRKLRKSGKFLLTTRWIDGYVRFKSWHEFDNFNLLREYLLPMLSNLECSGEWAIYLHSVPSNYKLRWNRENLFYYPSNGKLILTHSYMNLPIIDIDYYGNCIELFGQHEDKRNNKIHFERTVVKINWV